LLPDGLRQIQLRPGLSDDAKVTVVGAGAALTVQLRRSAGSCVGATFSAPFARNDGSQLNATSD
jgi:hypothetical protein